MNTWKRGYEPKEDENDLTERLIDDADEQVRKYTSKTGNRELDGMFNSIEDRIGYEINLKDAAAIPISGIVVKLALGLGSILFPPLALFALPAGIAVSTAAGALYHKRHKLDKKGGEKEA